MWFSLWANTVLATASGVCVQYAFSFDTINSLLQAEDLGDADESGSRTSDGAPVLRAGLHDSCLLCEGVFLSFLACSTLQGSSLCPDQWVL